MGWENIKKNFFNFRKNFKKLIIYFFRTLITILNLHPSQIFFRIIKKFRRFYGFLYIFFFNFNKIQLSKIDNNSISKFLDKSETTNFNGEFNFNNLKHNIDLNYFPNNVVKNKLWNYNLNYFDFINSSKSYRYKNKIIFLIDRWIENNKIFDIENDSYPTSLRIVNWIKWSIKNNYYEDKFLNSLKKQTIYLSKNIEYDLISNHIFTNIKAMIFAGFYFKGYFSDCLLKKALKLLNKEIHEQINLDGSHCELSPMYHAIILEDLLDILNILKTNKNINLEIINLIIKKINPMLRWLENMTHENNLFFFNDTCNKISNNFDILKNYANELNIEYFPNLNNDNYIHYFKESGFINCKFNDFRIVFDTGDIGYKFNPGHAHADCLSFELIAFNQKIFVNSGISTYENTKLRHFQRSTKSHNTVSINNLNSSDVWESFRVASVAKSEKDKIKIHQEDNFVEIQSAHSGYSSLLNKIIHKRNIIIERRKISIEDSISGHFKNAIAFFYLHPKVKIIDNSKIILNNNEIDIIVDNAEFDFIDSKWYPEFNKQIQNSCLILKLKDNNSKLTLKWN